MGMEVKSVRNLFLAENSIIGGAAFLLGSLLGTVLSGLLNQVVQNIFEIPHRYQVLFSLRALGMTLFFFHPDVWIWDAARGKGDPAQESD
mgnify:CR=1 FL=1